MRVSLICPVRRDTVPLARLLAQVSGSTQVMSGMLEVIVSGTPEDEVAREALGRAYPRVQWVTGPTGRGQQMNTGASHATGDWLWFVHADSRVPVEWADCFRRLHGDLSVAGGSFGFALDSGAWQARLLERLVALRVRVFELPYGDQGLFVRREVFARLGGFRPMPLMEDVEFVGRLRREGRIRHLNEKLVTSARRWEQEGWFRRSAGNLWTLLQYRLGVPPERLARKYYGKI